MKAFILLLSLISVSFSSNRNLNSNEGQEDNTAVIPVPVLEEDSYDWWHRHYEILRIKDSINPEIVLIGNSITHFWEGTPAWVDKSGNIHPPRAEEAWKAAFGSKRVLNLGFGWDRTQNVLWRLENGEMDGLDPKYTVVHIGTNNTSQTENARRNSAEEIAAGVKKVCREVKMIVPDTEIILMSIFPREQYPDHPQRILIDKTNQLLHQYAVAENIKWVDIGPELLYEKSILTREMASDFCHPTKKGYQVWANALIPVFKW